MSTAFRRRAIIVVLLVLMAVLWILAAAFKLRVTPFFHAVLIKRLGMIPVLGFMFVAPLIVAMVAIMGPHAEIEGAYNVVLDHVSASWGEDETLTRSL